MRICIFTVIFALFSGTLHAQRERAIDSLNATLATILRDDPARVDVLNELSSQSMGVDFLKAVTFADSAATLASKIGYQKGLAIAMNLKADCNQFMGNTDLSIDQAMIGVGIAEKQGLTAVLIESYRVLGIAYSPIDKSKAVANLLKSEALALQAGDQVALMKVYMALGVVKSYYVKLDSSIAYFDKALSLAEENGQQFHIPLIRSNRAYTVERGTSKSTGLDQYFDTLTEIVEQAIAVDNRLAHCVANLRLAEFYHTIKQYKKADEYHLASIAIAEKMHDRVMLKSNYFSMMALKVELGDFWGGHTYMKKYYDLKEQLMNEKKSRQIIEIETRYETEKKEATIKLLEREHQIQNIFKYVWITGSIFVLFVILIIYRLQIQKNKKSQQLLEAQKELNVKLKETDQLKSRFFANLSHEFRTPLSLILAPVEEQIKKGKAKNGEMENLILVRRNANRLLEMVNELLDLSKLEAKKMKLSVRRGQIKGFLSVLTSSFESLADHKNINTNTKLDISDKEVWFDADNIEKVVNNLLSNAYKFTPVNGTVTFSASMTNDESMVRITVGDTGPGIPLEDQQFIFSPFFQSSNNREIHGHGTGLGLALVKELMELHKGNVSLVSNPGKGSLFTISFPVTRESFSAEEISETVINTPKPITTVEDKDIITEVAEGNNERSVLIVEDNSDLLAFISSVFRDKYSILTAQNGKEGLQQAIAKQPDLIISDVMMPEMDGLTMLQKLRDDERISHIPTIILTARNESESRLKGFRSGADDYLAKPFSVEELRARVDNLVDQRKLLAVKYRERFVTAATPITVESVDEVFIKKVVTVIENHLSDSLFSVEKLAAEINLSRAQLFRKLKALMNVSPNQLINDIRLQRASELILSKADTLSQICYKVGFNEPSYFARRFRQKYGVTPSEYAERGSLSPI